MAHLDFGEVSNYIWKQVTLSIPDFVPTRIFCLFVQKSIQIENLQHLFRHCANSDLSSSTSRFADHHGTVLRHLGTKKKEQMCLCLGLYYPQTPWDIDSSEK